MALPAERIKSLRDDFNVPFADLTQQIDAEILNAKTAISENITGPLGNIVDAGKEKISAVKDAVENSDLVRSAKGAFGAIRDLSKITDADIDKYLFSLLPDTDAGAISEMMKLAAKCRNKPAQFGGLGKPYDANVSCNNGNSKKAGSNSCDVSQFSNVLNALSGGNYKSVFEDLNKSLARIVGLSNFGYDMELCGVFGALMGGQNTSVVTRAAAGVLATLSGKAKVSSQMDVAKSIGTRSGIVPTREIPNLQNLSTANYKRPSNVKANQIKDNTDAYVSSLVIIDGGVTDNKTYVPMSKIAPNGALVQDLKTSAVATNTISKANINKPVVSQATRLAMASVAKNAQSRLATGIRV